MLMLRIKLQYHSSASFMSGFNTREQNVCHTPFISDYSRVSKCLLASTCIIALEQYCSYFMQWK